jgi:hypothetical protein
VTRFAWLLALGACGGAADPPARIDAAPTYDAPYWPPWDAPPPLVDAGVPEERCSGHKAEQCPLPASRCVDENWLAYYTAGTCVDRVCQFTVELLYCYNGCSSAYGDGGCLPIFT